MWTHVKTLDGEIDQGIVFLLASDLSVNVAEHATTVVVCAATALLESFKLNDKDLGRRINLKLFRDVTVLFTNVAVPLVVTAENLLGGESSEARPE